jgi:uncharacterized protein DUF2785
MKKWTAFLCGLCVAIVNLVHANGGYAATPHDRAFWQAIARNKYAVPEGESADALAGELSGLLASPDPELRDDLAYSILAIWIHRRNIPLSETTLISLTDQWRNNLRDGLGESGTNSVLKRSFSALCLSAMAEREAQSPFMGADRYHALVVEAAAYLTSERDLRGYDANLHWIHATAHTADLLGALAKSPLLTRQEAASILAAVDNRLATASEVYTQGEQDRLAAAVVAVIRRNDFDSSGFAAWLDRIKTEDRDVWTAITVESLARFQNHNYMLQAVEVHLSLEQESPRIAEYRQAVLGLLRKRLG